jgi:hypothetical protein
MFKRITSLISVIKPSGTVHPMYNTFIKFSFASNVLSSTQNTLSTHSMLCATTQASTALAMSINFIGKDLIGQMGSLYFMNKLGSISDKNPKSFINKSLGIEQACVFVESLTPILPLNLFLPIASSANVCKNISFASFGSTNARIMNKMGTSNIGEMYTKLTIINTLASSIGMGVAGIIIAVVPEHEYRAILIPIIGFLRVKLYKKAIQAIDE